MSPVPVRVLLKVAWVMGVQQKMRNWLKSALVGATGVVAAMGMAAPASATPTGLTKLTSYASVPWENNTNGFLQHFNTVETYLDANFGRTDVDFLAFVYKNTVYPDASLQHAGLDVGGDLTGTSGNWTFDNGNTTYKVVAIELMVLGPTVNGNETLNTIVYSVDSAHSGGSKWDTTGFKAQNGQICQITSPYKSQQCPTLLKIAFFGIPITHHTPEPASIALVATGLAGLGLRRRKNKKRA